MKAIILKTKDGFNGKGGKVGCLYFIRCNQCDNKKWISGSIVKNGGGKFCSKDCYTKHQETLCMAKAPRWKGGRVKMQGYWQIKQPDGRYRREHMILMEKKIGRKLYTNECVHHINGDRLDNNLENLKLMTKSDHNKLHYKEMLVDKQTGKIIKKLS